MALDLVEGWTERIRYTIIADGVAVNLAGKTVELLVYDKRESLKSMAGDVDVETAASGLVYFDPDVNDLKHAESPYVIRWKVTASGVSAFFPSEAPEQWFWMHRRWKEPRERAR